MGLPIDQNPNKSPDVDASSTPSKLNIPTPQAPVTGSKDLLETVIGNLGIPTETSGNNVASDSPVLQQGQGVLEGNEESNPDTQKMMQSQVGSMSNKNPQILSNNEYPKVFAKLFPVASSFLAQNSGNQESFNNVRNTLVKGAVELQNEMIANNESLNFPEEVQEMISTMDLENPESYETLSQTIDNFAKGAQASTEKNTLPVSSSTDPATVSESALPQGNGQAVLDYFCSIVKALSTVESFPDNDKPTVLLLSMASMAISSQDIFGVNLLKLNQGLTDLTLNLATQLDLIPENKSVAAKNYLASVFDQFLLGGVLMGKTLILKPNGQLIDIGNKDHLSQLLLSTKPETKIFDQMPFSLLAFFAPFRDLKESSSKVIKEAKQALMNLIRLMLRLVFMLLAALTGGVKLGKEGVALIIKENAAYFSSTLDDLIFSMKKISEVYGVNINLQVRFSEVARKALSMGNFADFWKHILNIFMKDTELSKFLSEIKDADPLYEAVHSLVKFKNLDVAYVRQQIQG